mmetsp:Transcript_26122/g.104509  ORF Transcript_26122/g.104509 Transcript_26122/m.104509 type:complete len:238 (-) Transcript_26122:245-958(-)
MAPPKNRRRRPFALLGALLSCGAGLVPSTTPPRLRVVPRRATLAGNGLDDALSAAAAEAIPSDVTIGAAAPFADSQEDESAAKPEAMPPATLGDADGYWHRFDKLDGSEVYCRGKAAEYHWTQNRDTLQLLVKLPRDGDRRLARGDVAARTRRKEFVLTAPVAFGGELAHPVDTDLSHWYLEDDADGAPFLVIELAKEDSFWNWASVFADDDAASSSEASASENDAGSEPPPPPGPQ